MTLDENIAKPRAIVKSNPSLSAKDLCEMFDNRQIPVPRRWKDAGIEWRTKPLYVCTCPEGEDGCGRLLCRPELNKTTVLEAA